MLQKNKTEQAETRNYQPPSKFIDKPAGVLRDEVWLFETAIKRGFRERFGFSIHSFKRILQFLGFKIMFNLQR